MNPGVTIPVWQLLVLSVTLILSFLGFVFSVWKIITLMRDKNADEIKRQAAEAVAKADENEKSLLRLRAELPLEYVRREDWIRNQTVIEAKLDALAAKLDQGGKHAC
ncbi:hypothetical protein [Pseudodesulfovibrio sp.]|uniref:hypothetical protein n=1 Tax=Pseudodesulfovibrio sp. TaxID=2035812 RepID=UPI00262FA5CD|nr:hypothetical protein [Pseudodesulfovibrio sp.]MDD3310968.1 hypothetical protein [Pseudodesulfovibrio sp.]